MPPVTVGFISLGCAKNRVDSQLMADSILASGLKMAARPEEADIVVINTCAFIDDARDESMQAIRESCALKAEGHCKAIIVAGCLSQRYKGKLQKELPEVDAFIGLDELDKIADIAKRVAGGESRIMEISKTASRVYDPDKPGVVFSGGAYAYLKIAEGCNHFCSFCAIPLIRGRYRSREIAGIVREAESLLGRGFKELSLISQDITSYGRDLDGQLSLPALLRELSALGGKFWIRLLYGYPSFVTDELLETMASLPQVCHYLDLPVQHSHPEILKMMGRTETVESVRNLPARIRKYMPDAAIRTTCLVGFPGETDEYFKNLLEFVREGRFDHLGVFAYSPEEGTRALDLPGRPARELAEERRGILMQEQKKIVKKKADSLVGRETEVLLERVAGEKKKFNTWLARSPRQAPEVDGITIVEKVSKSLKPGSFIKVRYTGHDDYDMIAE